MPPNTPTPTPIADEVSGWCFTQLRNPVTKFLLKLLTAFTSAVFVGVGLPLTVVWIKTRHDQKQIETRHHIESDIVKQAVEKNTAKLDGLIDDVKDLHRDVLDISDDVETHEIRRHNTPLRRRPQ